MNIQYQWVWAALVSLLLWPMMFRMHHYALVMPIRPGQDSGQTERDPECYLLNDIGANLHRCVVVATIDKRTDRWEFESVGCHCSTTRHPPFRPLHPPSLSAFLPFCPLSLFFLPLFLVFCSFFPSLCLPVHSLLPLLCHVTLPFSPLHPVFLPLSSLRGGGGWGRRGLFNSHMALPAAIRTSCAPALSNTQWCTHATCIQWLLHTLHYSTYNANTHDTCAYGDLNKSHRKGQCQCNARHAL